MCVQDVKIGRQSATSRFSGASAASPGTRIAPADPARIAITFAYATAPDTVNQPFVLLCYNTGSGLSPLAAVSMEHPCTTVTIGEQGLGVTGELFAVAIGVGTPAVLVDMVRLNIGLDDI